MTKRASKRSAKNRSRSETISERVEVAGARPATFKLVEKAEGSYDLFRSRKKIGTARVEEDDGVSARFAAPDGSWSASAKSAPELLSLVGRYLLTIDARAAAMASIEESPLAKANGRKTAEERLSIAFPQKAHSHRVATLDQLLAAMREGMKASR
jgi:hypothetical protein